MEYRIHVHYCNLYKIILHHLFVITYEFMIQFVQAIISACCTWLQFLLSESSTCSNILHCKVWTKLLSTGWLGAFDACASFICCWLSWIFAVVMNCSFMLPISIWPQKTSTTCTSWNFIQNYVLSQTWCHLLKLLQIKFDCCWNSIKTL